METPLFVDIIYILLLSAAALFVCNRLRIPAIAGFLLAGVLVGPQGLGLVQALDEVERMAEIGVVLLMFTIGIEFSFENLLRIKKLVLLGGALQITGTSLACFPLLIGMGLPFPQALFIALVVALSSTAIVLRALQSRGEIDTPHGRLVLGILIFQDLLVIPLMLAIPLLAGAAHLTAEDAAAFIGTTVLFGGVLVVLAKWVIPWVLHHIVRTRDADLFSIATILLVLSIAYLTQSIGLSLALGAFLAGLILSASHYGQRALGNVLPLRDIFMSFFFVSIGMLFNVRTIQHMPVLIVGGTALLIVLKFLIAACSALLLGLPLRASLLTGFSLAQIGEFSFVLAACALKAGLFSAEHFHELLGVSICSMLTAPFVIACGNRFADAILKIPLPRRMKAGMLSQEPQPRLIDHLVIIGFGLSGRHIASAAETAAISYVVIDANPDTVREEHSRGRCIYYGDASYRPILEHAGIPEARAAVIAISDPVGTRRVVEQVRLLSPTVHIIVRTRYFAEVEALLSLGANEVVAEEYEASIEMFARVLYKYLVPKEEIDGMVARIRADGYDMLRSPSVFKTTLQDLGAVLSDMEVRVIRVQEGSNAIGRSLAELNLRKDYGITVLAVNRAGDKRTLPDGAERFQEGDAVVLLGLPELLVFADTIFKPSRAEPLKP